MDKKYLNSHEYPLNCPHCDVLLDDGDIYDKFFEMGKTKEEALEAAKMYGWTAENRKRFSKIIGIYCMEKDRTTHFICPECKKKIMDR